MTADREALARGLARVRRRRLFLLALVVVYLPAIWLSLRLSGSDAVTGVVFGVWFALVLVAGVLVSFVRCPRCGNYFHVSGFVPIFPRRCVHCELPLRADRDPGEPEPPPTE